MSSRRTRFVVCSAVLALGALVVGAVATADTRGGSAVVMDPSPSVTKAAEPGVPMKASAPVPRPNIVLIMTDDMRADDLEFMPRTRRALRQFRLTEFVSNHPLCCPARAELLTGQLAQHNGVHHNDGPAWGGYSPLRGKDNTVAQWFRRSGYSTAVVGKFINGWCPSRHARPVGWTDFTPLVRRAYSAFDYFYYDNSRIRPAPKGLHTNDFVTRETLARIGAYEADDAKPFFIWSSFVAPHDMERADGSFGPPVPAVRHQGTMAGVKPLAQSHPSYSEPSARQRALAFDDLPVACPGERSELSGHNASIQKLNQRRLESLQSVDEGVGRMVRRLERLGELGRTVLVFTSDNGYLLGEHGLMGKNHYYEESLRVPLLARGPGVASGESAKDSMITDLSPSFAQLGQVAPRRAVDGRRNLFAAGGGWDGLLIQASSDEKPWDWRGVRTKRWTYVDLLNGNKRLYDREADPHQLHDLAGRRPRGERQLRAELAALRQ